MHASGPGSPPGLGEYYSRCKNLALYIRDCEYLCLSDETVKAVGPFYLVSMPGEVKDPTHGVNGPGTSSPPIYDELLLSCDRRQDGHMTSEG